MTGRGGGNFYVPVLVAAGLIMHEAATTCSIYFSSHCNGSPVSFSKAQNSRLEVGIGNRSSHRHYGLLGHTISGDFNPFWTIPLVIVAVLGGLFGGRLSIKTNPENLKRIFAYTTLAAAVFMILNALFSMRRQKGLIDFKEVKIGILKIFNFLFTIASRKVFRMKNLMFGLRIIPLYHPAVAVYNQEIKEGYVAGPFVVIRAIK